MNSTQCLVVALAISSLGPFANAEKADLSPKELKETATHVVQGQVVAIYERKFQTDDWAYTQFLAEVKVSEPEKGKDFKKDELIYIRYWHRGWIADRDPEPNTSGHRGLPAEGDLVRVYLSRNAYDGFGTTKDGGFNVIGANGFEIIAKKVAEAN